MPCAGRCDAPIPVLVGATTLVGRSAADLKAEPSPMPPPYPGSTGECVFADIRTRRNLTYDVHAPFVENAAVLGGLYVTTTSPDVTLGLMRAHVTELQRELLDAEGLKRLSAQFVTEYLLDNETNAAQADFLARAELFRGDFKVAERFVDELRDVTPREVRAAAQKYMKNMRFAYVGDSTKVDRRLLLGF